MGLQGTSFHDTQSLDNSKTPPPSPHSLPLALDLCVSEEKGLVLFLDLESVKRAVSRNRCRHRERERQRSGDPVPRTPAQTASGSVKAALSVCDLLAKKPPPAPSACALKAKQLGLVLKALDNMKTKDAV